MARLPAARLCPLLPPEHEEPFLGGKRSRALRFWGAFFAALPGAGCCSWWDGWRERCGGTRSLPPAGKVAPVAARVTWQQQAVRAVDVKYKY